jgi:hypothetical protein
MSEGEELNFLRDNLKSNTSPQPKVIKQTVKPNIVVQQGSFSDISLTSASKDILTQKTKRIEKDSDMYRCIIALNYLANYAQEVINSDDMNKLNQIKKTYTLELSEKELAEDEKIRRYKARTQGLEDKYEIDIKMPDTVFQVYRNAMYRYYSMSKDLQANQKKKIFKVRKRKQEGDIGIPASQSLPTYDVYKAVLVISGGLLFIYILYKKKFKY